MRISDHLHHQEVTATRPSQPQRPFWLLWPLWAGLLISCGAPLPIRVLDSHVGFGRLRVLVETDPSAKFVASESGTSIPMSERDATAHSSLPLLVLVDGSEASIAHGKLGEIALATERLVQRHADRQQRVGVFVFDGGGVRTLVPLARAKKPTMDGLLTLTARKGPRKLQQAVQHSIRALRVVTLAEAKPWSKATLVIYLHGDLQADEEVKSLSNIEGINVRLVVFGKSTGIHSEFKARFANDGESLISRFSDLSTELNHDLDSLKLLSFCSPSRVGSHEFTIRADTSARRGETRLTFRSDGSTAGCIP